MAFDSLPEAEKGYLAGLIDGEAYIGITKSIRKDNGRVRYAPSCRIRMTDYAIVKSLHLLFSGSYHYYRKTPKKHKDQWEWVLDYKQGRDFIEKILPYLKIKKPQALVYLEYYKAIPDRRGRKKRTDAEIQAAELLYQKMRKLNKRGK